MKSKVQAVKRKGLLDNWDSYSRKRDPRVGTRTRTALLEKQNYKCAACGCSIGTIHSKVGYEIDHIIPYSFTQNKNLDNLQALCPLCNSLASNFIFSSKFTEKAHFLKNQYILQQRCSRKTKHCLKE